MTFTLPRIASTMHFRRGVLSNFEQISSFVRHSRVNKRKCGRHKNSLLKSVITIVITKFDSTMQKCITVWCKKSVIDFLTVYNFWNILVHFDNCAPFYWKFYKLSNDINISKRKTLFSRKNTNFLCSPEADRYNKKSLEEMQNFSMGNINNDNTCNIKCSKNSNDIKMQCAYFNGINFRGE